MKQGEPKLTVRVIRRCNFRCPLCSTFSGPHRKGTIRFADFARAVDILREADFGGILNISGGEPTLHPRLTDMVEYAAERLPAVRVAVFTNGHWVGCRGWRARLGGLLGRRNVLLRFSLDRQHAEGALRARGSNPTDEQLREMELKRLKKARLFIEACLATGAVPGENFDFAFKGSETQARAYTRGLGDVPLHLIKFRKDPANRPKELGFFAIDVDEKNDILVYPSLGHIPAREPLGGLETLSLALEMNRHALRTRV